uniref:Uncharacterized protein n=1 Tax=Avena sativa TaxID=4498 RepID=A0ACD5VMM4_AVESA
MHADATMLMLWVWSADPNKIPKVQYVTVVCSGAAPSVSSTAGRRGLVRHAIIHLDLHEDFTPDKDGRPPCRVTTNSFDTIPRVVYGERSIKDRARTPSRSLRDGHGRRDDDRVRRREDDDDRGHGRDAGHRSWAGRLFSRSCFRARASHDHGRDHDDQRCYDSRDGRRGGGRNDRDGRRHEVEPVAPGSRSRSPARTARRPGHASACGRSLLPSSRPNSSFVLEARRSVSPVDWLRRASPCFRPQVSPQVEGLEAFCAGRLDKMRMQLVAPSHPTAAAVSPPIILGPILRPVIARTPVHASTASTLVPVTTSTATTTPISPAQLVAMPDPSSSSLAGCTPRFVPIQQAILTAPDSTPPRPPAARHKTLARVTNFVGFPVQRSSPRLKKKCGSMSIAKLTEKVLCHRLGIASDGEPITEAAIAKFVAMFNGQLPDIVISALRALFGMDCDFASAVEEALV